MILEAPVRRWECRRCNKTAVTRNPQPHTEFHMCIGMGGFNVPMTEVGQRSQVNLVEREDYIGAEDVQLTADGRPVMAAVTEYADGHTDCTVYAPTVRGKAA